MGAATAKLREPKHVRTRGTANKLQSDVLISSKFVLELSLRMISITTYTLQTLFSSFSLMAYTVLLLEHIGVDKFMPLLTICSTMPSLLDADVEGLHISGNSSQPSFSGTSSYLVFSSRWVGCSLQLPGLCDDLRRVF